MASTGTRRTYPRGPRRGSRAGIGSAKSATTGGAIWNHSRWTMTKTDAIYARYSSHAQDDSTSIEVQIEQCERAAGGKCQHYIDRAKTGRAMGGRTELLRLLADAEASKIKRVLVY